MHDTINLGQTREPSEEEKKIYALLISPDGQVLMDWLRNRTIERQIGEGVADGIQTAILTHRQLGRSDVYHELKRLINVMTKYASRQ